MSENDFYTATVSVELNDIIENDFEGFLDIIIELALANTEYAEGYTLQNISYVPIGANAETHTVEITINGHLTEF